MMKYLLSTILLLLIVGFSYCQLTVTIQQRSFCTYHFDEDILTDCVSKPETSVFHIDKYESEICFTVDGVTDTYHVMGTTHQHYGIFTYRVLSHMNNEYILIFDLKKGWVVALFIDDYEKGNKTVEAVRFRIKEII